MKRNEYGLSDVLFLLIFAASFSSCAHSRKPYDYLRESGAEISEIEFRSKDDLTKELSRKIKDETDLKVESALLPSGGKLHVVNSHYYDSKNTIYRMVATSGGQSILCDDAELSGLRGTVHGLGMNGQISPGGIPIVKDKTEIECKLDKKMELPIKLIFESFSGDTLAVYSIKKGN